jgi:molybdopterin synthase sulfur carrier subunit
MSIVRIPPVLRANAGGNKSVEIDGSTVGDVLTALVGQYPGLRSQLLTDGGELNRFVNVYLNDQDIRYLQERGTPVDARDTLIILPAMAGGAR